jgi:hypothetical protein
MHILISETLNYGSEKSLLSVTLKEVDGRHFFITGCFKFATTTKHIKAKLFDLEKPNKEMKIN